MKKYSLCAMALAAALLSSVIWACTGIQLQTTTNQFVNGRTVEFGVPLKLNGVVVPRNYTFKGLIPGGSTGLVYKSKYAAVGASTFSANEIVDGFNEKGLSAAMFYFPNYAKYTPLTSKNKRRALAPTQFVNWVLTQFASVDEVKAHLKSIVVVPTSQKDWSGVAPMHFIVYDKTGASIAIEPVNGQLQVTDNPIGVFTNSPTFAWHMTNLNNYINLSPYNVNTAQIDSYTLRQFGEGTGMLGLPGDFTPPSRFIRAAMFASNAVRAQTADQAVFEAFHILNQFDIPPGAVQQKNANAKPGAEITIATTVKDPNNLKYYFRTFADQNVRVIDLKKFDPNAKQVQWILFNTSQPLAQDVSNTATTQAP